MVVVLNFLPDAMLLSEAESLDFEAVAIKKAEQARDLHVNAFIEAVMIFEENKQLIR